MMSHDAPRHRPRSIGGALAMLPPIVVWMVAVGWPAALLAMRGFESVREIEPSAPAATFHAPDELLATTLGWTVAVTLLSAIAGWPPGRVLGGLLGRRGFVACAALVMLPLCLPAYVVFFAWWQSWPPDSAMHRWVVEHDLMQHAREATLLIALVCWSWPLVAVSVAGAAANRPRHFDDMLLVDRASRLRRFASRVRTDSPGLVLGMTLVFLATLNNTTCFDLAEVFTVSNDLRAAAALGADDAAILRASLPMIGVTLALSLAVWRSVGNESVMPAMDSRKPGLASLSLTIVLWFISVALPLALFIAAMSRSAGLIRTVSEFASIYGENILFSLISAMLSAGIAAVAVIGLAIMWFSERALFRRSAEFIAATSLAWSLLPATLLGAALRTAYQDALIAQPPSWQPWILNIAHLSASGFVIALLARWVFRSEPQSLRDMRRIDHVRSAAGFFRSTRPAMLAAGAAGACAVAAIAMAEVVITPMIVPPLPVERTPIAMTILNDMHYQRPQAVLAATVIFMLLGGGAAVLLASLWAMKLRLRPAVSATASLVIGAAILTGCSRSDASDPQPLDPEFSFGSPGQSPGQFGYPRAIDVNPRNQFVYVIDKTARVQRFGFDGAPQLQWSMPARENGKPTGVTVAPNGNVYVADTHYFRVIEYDAGGNEVRRFGEYGEGPGQFIYLTDIAFAPNGNIYVSEYGGNDRVQVFSPAGNYLSQFGSFGRANGEFNRPQSLTFSRDGKELYIADACNHRIVVTDPDGAFLRTFGEAGRGVGQLAYPYSICVLPDHSLLVCEFGNNRLQRFSRDGESLGTYGRVGRSDGELQYPWAAAATDDLIFVLDSGNNRVQVIEQF